MSNENILKVQEYKNNLIIETEQLITHGFPQKIVELYELLSTPMFSDRNFDEVHQDLNVPIPDPIVVNSQSARHDGGGDADQPPVLVPCNGIITQMLNIVKPIIRKLVEDSKSLRMWIIVMIPKMEDGNNFGVAVQEETLGQIESVVSQGEMFFEHITNYYLKRAKAISKVAKFPQIEDYRRAVIEVDESEFCFLRLVVQETFNHYIILHDIVLKNIEKLKNPRSSNIDALY